MKVVFFGTSDYCLPVLEALNINFELRLVVTRPDKPVGRKKVLTPSATKNWAIEHHIPLLTPETLKKDTQDRLELEKILSDIKPDLAIVADFGLMIPQGIIDIPKLGIFNIHFSKLPDLRGASPVQATLLRGNTEAWITIFQLEKDMDTGPVLWQASFPIDPNDTTKTLYTRLFIEAAKILPTLDFSSKLTPQDHTKATYTKLLTKDDGFVDYKDLEKPETYNRFRAMTPWPSLWTLKAGKRMIIRNCHLEGNKLVLDEIQFEGKNPIRVS